MTQARRQTTSTQPEVGPIKVYSGAVIPFDSARNQPPVDRTLKIYGAKRLPTICVRLRDSDGNLGFFINEKDFDSDIHEKVE